MYGIILDLDQTLIDTSISEPLRKSRNWSKVYELIPKFKPYENIIEIIGRLIQKGFAPCIVTNSPYSYCNKIINYWKIPVTHTVCFHDTRRHKPDPEPFLAALKKLELSNQHAISFGDTNEDIIASNKANIDSVLCRWGQKQDYINSEPSEYSLNSPAQIENLLGQWTNKKTVVN